MIIISLVTLLRNCHLLTIVVSLLGILIITIMLSNFSHLLLSFVTIFAEGLQREVEVLFGGEATWGQISMPIVMGSTMLLFLGLTTGDLEEIQGR